MSDAPPREPGSADPGLSFHGFVALIAAIMACQALGIDTMLPALAQIGQALSVASENDRQWIVALYMFGFGAAQLVYGPLADRYGRRPILIVSLSLFAITSIAAGLATSFTGLLVYRFLQGVVGAAGRVLAVSVVRDCYQGRQMARVMSLSFIVFLAVPALAPSIGQIIMLVADWRGIFFFLAAFSAMVALIGGLKLNETLHPDHRQPISVGGITSAIGRTLLERNAIGYTLAMTAVFGALMGFINSVQQIFADIFHAPNKFPLMFACIAGAMGTAAFINSRIVERFGTRVVSHSALLGFIGASSIHLVVAVTGYETMATFIALQCLTMFCFGMMGSNFGSMAMESMGEIAGTASSVQGFISTVGGSIIGIIVGQSFNGTTVPMVLGFVSVGVAALVLVLATERWKLFRPHHAA
ncbi:multidrug effflux MFS transporter [Sphingomonas sp. MMS24-J13]|uniref:multidrug effflux MFS transporter n=1 Tax=Sphingomonas sp. MMS24-J13 TaxID=3238686 RepID=UPI00384D76C8